MVKMERLTVKWTDGIYDTFDPVDVLDNDYSKINYKKIITKLGKYEDLEEQKRLFRLPCNVGDKIYWINGKFIMESEVINFCIDEDGLSFAHVRYLADKEHNRYYGHNIDIENIGKTAFFTREAAEQKLKEIENDLKDGE